MRATAAPIGLVTVVPVRSLKQPVTLRQIKSGSGFCGMGTGAPFSRLSVMPVSDAIWQRIEGVGRLSARPAYLPATTIPAQSKAYYLVRDYNE